MKLVKLQMQRLFVSMAVWMLVTIPTPLWAAEDEKKMEWVLSYFCVLLFIILGTLVLMRPTKRSDTVLSSEEQFAAKQERLKAAH